MNHPFLFIAGISGILSVALGAFGAHGLKNKLSSEMMTVFQTGVQYHQVHTIALLAIAIFLGNSPSSTATYAGWFFTAGILVFSGSLYALAITEIKILGAITPIGGLAFLVGWALLVKLGFQQA